MSGAELVVDGPRPAVAWVSSLPASWASPGERLVLYALANDAYDTVSAPGGANLVQWTGLLRSTVYDALKSLCKATPKRPALLERLDRNGQPLDGKQYGRERTRYRLRVEVHSTVRQNRTVDSHSQQSGKTGRLGRKQSGNSPNNSPNNSPAKPDTPFPSPNPSDSLRSSGPPAAQSARNKYDPMGGRCWSCDGLGEVHAQSCPTRWRAS
jgi:hypothetical protein